MDTDDKKNEERKLKLIIDELGKTQVVIDSSQEEPSDPYDGLSQPNNRLPGWANK